MEVANVDKDAKYLVHTVHFGKSTNELLTKSSMFTLHARKTARSTDNGFET